MKENKIEKLVEEITKELADYHDRHGYISLGVVSRAITRIGKAFRDGGISQFRGTLEKARHELETLHGLVVSDGFESYHRAQQAGADCEGAWQRFVEDTWIIDTQEIIEAINQALRPEEQK